MSGPIAGGEVTTESETPETDALWQAKDTRGLTITELWQHAYKLERRLRAAELNGDDWKRVAESHLRTVTYQGFRIKELEERLAEDVEWERVMKVDYAKLEDALASEREKTKGLEERLAEMVQGRTEFAAWANTELDELRQAIASERAAREAAERALHRIANNVMCNVCQKNAETARAALSARQGGETLG